MASGLKNQAMKYQRLLWVMVFAVSMGYFESAIVIYLREIVYPNGFAFPLQPISSNLATTEIYREAFSLLMLLAAGVLAGRTKITRFAYFMFAFAVWDIFYYIFLKLLINWPDSLMTMDILFLLPITWIGPVLAPCLLSCLMIVFAMLILYFASFNKPILLKASELWFLMTGSFIVIVSFALDYAKFVFNHDAMADIWSLPTKDLYHLSQQYYPGHFYWSVFWAGTVLILVGIGLFTWRNHHLIRDNQVMKSQDSVK